MTYPLTDAGNAQRLVNSYADSIAYVDGTGWYCRDATGDGPWQRATFDDLAWRAAAITWTMHTIANGLADDQERRELVSHAIRSESESAVRLMIDAAARDPRVRRSVDELEAAA